MNIERFYTWASLRSHASSHSFVQLRSTSKTYLTSEDNN